jgi:hypothetical protein
MRLKVIACEVVARELYACAARARQAADVTLLPQGLHDNSDTCRTRLQERINAVDAQRFDAVLLGYGLCNNSLMGLVSGPVPLVVPRAHDCITLLLGSKERYAALFAERPGTYWFSSGWIESHEREGERFEPRQNSGLGPTYGAAYDELVAKYGEDNARYLADFMKGWEAHYTHGCLITFDFTAHLGLDDKVRRLCAEKGWEFAAVPGDLRLLQAGLDGDWDNERFLVLREAGLAVRPSHDDAILSACPAACCSPGGCQGGACA